jgi:hypothetical protein
MQGDPPADGQAGAPNHRLDACLATDGGGHARSSAVLVAGLWLLLGLLAGPATARAAPALTISPSSGPSGIEISARAIGLDPGSVYLVQVVSGVGNVNTVRVFETTATADARGDLATVIAVRQPPGRYTVRVVGLGGTVIATAALTIVGPPALPATGHGGAA